LKGEEKEKKRKPGCGFGFLVFLMLDYYYGRQNSVPSRYISNMPSHRGAGGSYKLDYWRWTP
jgi:hypothetical protein